MAYLGSDGYKMSNYLFLTLTEEELLRSSSGFRVIKLLYSWSQIPVQGHRAKMVPPC